MHLLKNVNFKRVYMPKISSSTNNRVLKCCIHILIIQCVRLCPEIDFERWLASRCLFLLKAEERKGHKTILHLRCQKRCQQSHVAIFYWKYFQNISSMVELHKEAWPQFNLYFHQLESQSFVDLCFIPLRK